MMKERKNTDERLDYIENELFSKDGDKYPNIFIGRFQEVENFTEFELNKQIVLNSYEKVLSNVEERNFKIIQDIKLVKLYSLTCNLVWYNQALKYYTGRKMYSQPLISLMEKKKRYFHLCDLRLHQLKMEFGKDIEMLFRNVIVSAYNSMIDSDDLSIGTALDKPRIVNEHSSKVEEVNKLFKELSNKINQILKYKFPEDDFKIISDMQFSIQ